MEEENNQNENEVSKSDSFGVILYNENFEKFYEYFSPTYQECDVDILSILKICKPVKKEKSVCKDGSFNIKVVFSMQIQRVNLDIASCCGIFCVSFTNFETNNQICKASAFNPISFLYSIVSTMIKEDNSLAFESNRISLKSTTITILYNIFKQITDFDFVNYIAYVSTFNEVFCTYGNMDLPMDEYCNVWQEGLDMASALHKTNDDLFNESYNIAVFSFLPTIKIFVLYSKQYLNHPDIKPKLANVQDRNALLIIPIKDVIQNMLILIPFLYIQ